MKTFLFLLLSSSLVGAVTGPSCEELNALWRDKFHGEIKVQWGYRAFNCPGETATIALAVWDIYQPQVRRPMAQGKTDFYQFVSDSMVGLSWSASGGDVGVPAATRQADARTFLFKPFLKESRLWRASLIVHESVHARKRDTHVPCVKGYAKGQVICDSGLGLTQAVPNSYGMQTLYLKWLRDEENVDGHSVDEINSRISFILDNYVNDVSLGDRLLLLGGPASSSTPSGVGVPAPLSKGPVWRELPGPCISSRST